MLVVFAFFAQRNGRRLSAGARQVGLPALLLAVVPTWLFVQLLPLGALLDALPIPGLNQIVLGNSQITIDPNSTKLALARQLSYGVLFFLILQGVGNPRRLEAAIKVILLSCVAYGLLGLVALQTGDWIMGVPKWAYLGSATGPFVNRNSFATFIAFGCVVAAAQFSRKLADRLEQHSGDGPIAYGKSSILLDLTGLLFLFAVIFASQSRMGLAAASIGVITVFVATAAQSKQAVPLATVGIFCLIILGLIAFALFGGGIFERFQTVEGSAEVRLDLYKQVLQLIQLRWWTGFGGGTFELAFPLVHALPVNVDVNWDKAHNTYLTLWSELGVIAGTAPMLAIALMFWRTALHSKESSKDWRSRSITLGAISVAAVHSLTDFSLEIEANAFLFVALLAIGLPLRVKNSAP
jgi:O-antigen ligase